jgi:hypothetical protein
MSVTSMFHVMLAKNGRSPDDIVVQALAAGNQLPTASEGGCLTFTAWEAKTGWAGKYPGQGDLVVLCASYNPLRVISKDALAELDRVVSTFKMDQVFVPAYELMAVQHRLAAP